MTARQIKTVDVKAKEWFDKTYGNSYFSMYITINLGRKDEYWFYVPMQYGSGDHYMYMALKAIKKELGAFKKAKAPNSYHRVYDQYNVIASHSKQENCLKREL